MDAKSTKPSLTKLYKNDCIRNLIWDTLSEDFADAFDRIIKEFKELRSPLVAKAKANREYIKEMFIEYGHKMESVTDMKRILDTAPSDSWEDDCDQKSDDL